MPGKQGLGLLSRRPSRDEPAGVIGLSRERRRQLKGGKQRKLLNSPKKCLSFDTGTQTKSSKSIHEGEPDRGIINRSRIAHFLLRVAEFGSALLPAFAVAFGAFGDPDRALNVPSQSATRPLLPTTRRDGQIQESEILVVS
jgi:hypothetical protein